MNANRNRMLCSGAALLVGFTLWTWVIMTIDVQAAGVNGTTVGLATINTWVHSLTGVHLTIYNITDWAGLVPVAVCLLFAVVGLCQLIARRGLLKVDADILLLGIYYVIVIACYLIFEMIPINYRPILIGGFMEASYPSSTTLLVLSVMPTLNLQVKRRVRSVAIGRIVRIVSDVFSALMVVGRLVSGVHWMTDIVGSVLLSGGLLCLYRFVTEK